MTSEMITAVYFGIISDHGWREDNLKFKYALFIIQLNQESIGYYKRMLEYMIRINYGNSCGLQ